MKAQKILWLSLVLIFVFSGVLQAAMVPNGPRSSRDPATHINSFHFGGDIVNYDSSGTWKPIQKNWVGSDSGFTVTKGQYSAYVDSSSGKIWYGYKGHYVGLQPFRLIWFRPADSSWTTIASATVEPLVLDSNTLTSPDPFGLGITLNYTYHPSQFFQGYDFPPAARDTLKKLYQAQGDNTLWFANVIQLDLSRVNASMKKLKQAFTGGDLDDNDYLEIAMDSASILYEPTLLEWSNPDFVTQDFYKLKRRVVNVGGTWYLVELINPRKVDTLSGTLKHQASITLQETTDNVDAASLYCGQGNGGTYFADQNRGANAAIELGYRYYSSKPLPEWIVLRFPDLVDSLVNRGVQWYWIDSGRVTLTCAAFGQSTARDSNMAMFRLEEYWVEGNSVTPSDIDGVAAHYRNDNDFTNNRTSPGTYDTLWTGYEVDTLWTDWLGGGFPTLSTFDDTIFCCTSTGAKYFGENSAMNALQGTLQYWMQNPSLNFGWLFTFRQVDGATADTAYIWFRSDDYSTASETPSLDVFYTDRGFAVIGPGSSCSGAWTNCDSVYSSDDKYATHNNVTGIGLMTITGFGFSLSGGDTVDSIYVGIEANGSASQANRRRLDVALTKNGSAAAADSVADWGEWANTDSTVFSTGSTNANWNTTWTPSEVNASTFGVMLNNASTLSGTMSVDYVEVWVYYTPGAGAATYARRKALLQRH